MPAPSFSSSKKESEFQKRQGHLNENTSLDDMLSDGGGGGDSENSDDLDRSQFASFLYQQIADFKKKKKK